MQVHTVVFLLQLRFNLLDERPRKTCGLRYSYQYSIYISFIHVALNNLSNPLTMCEERHKPLELLRQEAEEFITRNLEEDLPETHPVDIEWINGLIRAFQKKQPFQNITLLSKFPDRCVPSWEDIHRDIIQEGKGGLCLSLNFGLVAVLRAVGVCAHLLAADYVAGGARAVHAVTVIHIPNISEACRCCVEIDETKRVNTETTEHQNNNSDAAATRTLRRSRVRHITNFKSMRTNSLYIADVGCGFPTLQAINLGKDVDKIFVDCGLEYRFTRKGQRYLRMHRAGDEVSESEEHTVAQDGWRPVFAVSLIPRCLAYFQRTMRPIYVSLLSLYLREFHIVRYFTSHKMVAIKNGTLIKYLSVKDHKTDVTTKDSGRGILITQEVPQSGSETATEKPLNMPCENRVSLTEHEMLSFAVEHFPMVPRCEVERALLHYFSVE